MDVAILGMGLPAVYLASRLSAEGLSVGLFGGGHDLTAEPVSRATVREFALDDFVLNSLAYVARFSRDFRLTEQTFRGATIDVPRLHRHYLSMAVRYGCEVLAGSSFSLADGLRVEWRGKAVHVQADKLVLEQQGCPGVPAVLAGRVPFNEDTVEFYEEPGMWVVPWGDRALVGGDVQMAWSKFDQAAFLRSYRLPRARPAGRLTGGPIRIGRAAGHTSPRGFTLEASLYHARLLADILAGDGDMRVYEEQARGRPDGHKNGLHRLLSPQTI